MSFADDLGRFNAKVVVTSRAAFVNVATEAMRSVQEGSELTGAPGQPVDTGALKGSWQLTFPTPDSAQIATNQSYAEAVEDGVGPHGAVAYGKSGVGGSHSVRLTIIGMDRIVESVAAGAK